AGNYAIWVYTWEDNAPITFSFTLEGTAAVTNHNSGAAGTWSKLGPFLRTVSDGTLNLNVTGPDASLSGIEVYTVGGSTIPVTGVSVTPESASITVGEMLQLTSLIAPANATNTAVTWISSNVSVASVNENGVVTAAGVGSATITATTVSGNFLASSDVTVTASQANSLAGVIENFAFQYKYDGRKRMTHKKVPGADWVYMVYDNRDRLVMTQDGEQRRKSPTEWTFTKYDAFNRPVLTGIYADSKTLDDMQSYVNQFYSTAPEDKWFESIVQNGTGVHGYTNNSLPDVSSADAYLTVTLYDDYAFRSAISDPTYNYDANQLIASGNEKAQEASNFGQVKGQVTGTKVKNLETSEWYWTVNYYDDRYRVIQSIADNAKGGINKNTNVYDFTGKVLRSKNDHSISSGAVAATERRMTYDHVGRLLQTDHKTTRVDHPGNNGFVLLAKNEYNELGQMVKKGLHSTDNGSNFKQQVDYRYNIRGWLTRINDGELSATDGGPADYFGMELGYNDAMSLPGAMPLFNGNISAIRYSANLGLGINDEELELFESTQRGYAFRYDALNRLQHADHLARTLQWDASDSFDENGLSYDMNGNIQSLSRSGKLGAQMDVLGYQYRGNRLLSVTDTGDDEDGFKDGNTAGTDYLYDWNGNMTADLNKGISSITYNHLNLPARVEKNTGEYVKYYYDATGGKLSQEVYNASDELQKKSDYLGEYFYENDTLRFVNHEEGRVVINKQDPEYQYMLKDHLGNVRVTFTSKQTVETFAATMETGTQSQEQDDFSNYSSTVNDLLDHTDAGTAYNRVLVLNGGYNGQVALGKSFAVMPGDVVSAKVYAKYTGSAGQASQLGSFAAALTSAFGLAPVGVIDGPTAYSALNDIGGILATGEHPGEENADPKGFLNILVFDKDYNLVDFAFDQLGSEYEQTGVTKTAHDELIAEITARQAGYVYVFLSNEEPFELQVGFDDFEVGHRQSGVVQLEEYYPFGLTFNSYQRENSVANRFKFQGQEHVDDLSLNWDSFKWRNHQPDIGRFFSIDPLATDYVFNSPYAFSENKITAHRELEGLESRSSKTAEEINGKWTMGSDNSISTASDAAKEAAARRSDAKLPPSPSKELKAVVSTLETASALAGSGGEHNASEVPVLPTVAGKALTGAGLALSIANVVVGVADIRNQIQAGGIANVNPLDAAQVSVGGVGAAATGMELMGFGGMVAARIAGTANMVGLVLSIPASWQMVYQGAWELDKMVPTTGDAAADHYLQLQYDKGFQTDQDYFQN
ncbi:MAG TPA: Ig-like domain-containing protein, partial [Chryseolinea sp.]|nr:Ig-like domain-containing protein [Chryseolinea sp.]